MFLRVSEPQPASRRAEIRRAQMRLSGIPLSLKDWSRPLAEKDRRVSLGLTESRERESALILSVRGSSRPPPLFERDRSTPLHERESSLSEPVLSEPLEIACLCYQIFTVCAVVELVRISILLKKLWVFKG